MREILFRGKTDKGEWVEGCLLFDTEQNEAYIAEYFEDKAAYIREVIPETVGQYTGLTDKNGKKIFEGDYWLDTDGDYLVYVVEFREGQFGFACYLILNKTKRILQNFLRTGRRIFVKLSPKQ